MNTINQPNIVIQPTSPSPQTVVGIATAHGNEFADLTASYGDEFNIPKILGADHLISDKLITLTTDVISQGTIPHSDYPNRNLWQAILSMFTYITCDVVLTFRLIKPNAVSGRALFQYATNVNATFDTKLRSFKVEWDMSKTQILRIPVTNQQLCKMRICTGSHGYASDKLPSGDIAALGYAPFDELYKFGTYKLTMITPFQPGSIYPDTYRLLTFLSLKNAVVSVPRQYLSADVDSLIQV